MSLPKKRPKYTHSYISKGELRHYVRYQGVKHQEHILAPFGTPEFYHEHSAKLRELQNRIDDLGGITKELQQNTLQALYKLYIKSDQFAAQSDGTRKSKRQRFERLFQEKHEGTNIGAWKYLRMKKSDVRLLLNTKKGLPEAQNNRLKDLRALFKWALNHGDEYDLILPEDFKNPCTEIQKNAPTNTAGHHTWTIQEVHQFNDYHPIGTMPRLAISILLYTGARVSDAYLLGRTHEKTWLDQTTQQQTNMLSFIAQKNKQLCELPILPELREAIDACPSGNLVYLATSRGIPFQSAKSFSQWFVKKRKEAKLPDACVPHGLRKAGATFAAEAGATERQLMAMFGWKDPDMARKYTQAAENRKMAAQTMHMVTGEQK